MDQQVRVWKQGSSSNEEYRGGQIAGHVKGPGLQLGGATPAALNANGVADFLDGCAKFFQRQFGMVARESTLGDRGHAFGEESRQQHGGFYLGAGHRHFVVDLVQARAANLERGEIVFARANVRAHLSQRRHHAPHRALLERRVAGQLRGECLTRQDSGEQAHRGAGIPRIQRAPTAFQSARTPAGYTHHVLIHLYFRAERGSCSPTCCGNRRLPRNDAVHWCLPQARPALHSGGKWICRQVARLRPSDILPAGWSVFSQRNFSTAVSRPRDCRETKERMSNY